MHSDTERLRFPWSDNEEGILEFTCGDVPYRGYMSAPTGAIIAEHEAHGCSYGITVTKECGCGCCDAALVHEGRFSSNSLCDSMPQWVLSYPFGPEVRPFGYCDGAYDCGHCRRKNHEMCTGQARAWYLTVRCSCAHVQGESE